MPLISVIVPVYKVEPYLHECVDSILNQTFKDFELILVDDGSPDNCPAICDEYVKKDSRVIVIHKENGGLSSARNAGLDYVFANSDSEYISFVDSDDYIHSEYLSKLIEGISDCSVVCCSFLCDKEGEITTGNETRGLQRFYKEKAFLSFKDSTGFLCSAWAKMYKKELFKELRYPLGKLCEDEYVTYKCFFFSKTVRVVPEPLYYYRTRQNSITNSTDLTELRLYEFDAAIEASLFYYDNKDYDRFCSKYEFAINGLKRYINFRNSHYLLIFKKAKKLYKIKSRTGFSSPLQDWFFVHFPLMFNILSRLVLNCAK